MNDNKDQEARIRQQAYLMWLEDGRSEGGERERWERAKGAVEHMDRLVEAQTRWRARNDPEEQERLVRERAYRIWLDEGRPEGLYLDHWERAKREVEEELSMTEGTDEFAPPAENLDVQKNRERQ